MPTKRTTYLEGQAIIWIAKRTRSGEPQFEVPGYVVRMTAKRIAIKVLKKDAQVCIRYVTRARLIPAPAAKSIPTARPTPRGLRNAPGPRSFGN